MATREMWISGALMLFMAICEEMNRAMSELRPLEANEWTATIDPAPLGFSERPVIVVSVPDPAGGDRRTLRVKAKAVQDFIRVGSLTEMESLVRRARARKEWEARVRVFAACGLDVRN